MIAPRASGAFVCLRCELRASCSRPSPFLVRRLPHAKFVTSSIRRDDSGPANDADIPNTAEPQERPKLSSRPLKNTLGKVHKRKGKVFKEQVAKLDNVKTLGSDASIIVIRELDDGSKPISSSDPSEEPSSEVRSRSILASLDQSSGAVNQDEIDKQLDRLRPQTSSDPDEPQYISRAEYQKLSAYLHEGFNVKQLSQYFAHCKGIARSKVKEEVSADLQSIRSTVKQPIGKSQWYPGTTPLTSRLPGSGTVVAQSAVSKRMNKSSLVDNILRRGWRVELLEEIESVGELELTLKPWQVILLNTEKSDGTSFLDHVASTRKVKAEVIQSSVIRITAPKSNAEYAADDIEQLLQATTTVKFRLGDWEEAGILDKQRLPKTRPVDIYTSESLQHIGNTTGSYIQTVSRDTLQIRGMNDAAAQEAQRSLIRLLPIAQGGAPTVEFQKLEETKESSFFAPVPFVSDLPYPYRALNLGRWTAFVSRQDRTAKPLVRADTSASVDEKQTINDVDELGIPDSVEEAGSRLNTSTLASAHLQDRVCERLKFLREQRVDRPTAVGYPHHPRASWVPDQVSHIGVEYHQALFEGPANHPAAGFTTPFEKTRFFPYAYSTSVPGLPKVLASESAGFEPERLTQSLIYEFVPSPRMQNRLDPKDGGKYPRLLLRFRFQDPGASPQFHSVRLRYDTQSHAVLLPDRATDMVFQRREQMWLKQPMAVDSIRTYVNAVRESIESGVGRLSAPPQLTIEVPKCILPGYPADAKYTRSLTYLFKGVRHVQHFGTTFESYNAVYLVSQEGQLGRNHTALQLFSTGDGKPEPTGEALKQFVETAFRLADRVTEAAALTSSLGELAGLQTKDTMKATGRDEQGNRREDAKERRAIQNLLGDAIPSGGIQDQASSEESAVGSVEAVNDSHAVSDESTRPEQDTPDSSEPPHSVTDESVAASEGSAKSGESKSSTDSSRPRQPGDDALSAAGL